MVFYSELQQGYIWLPVIGFIVGILATMVGSGGGSFFPMVLMILYNVPAPTAVATSLASSLPLSLTGALSHYRMGNIHKRVAIIYGLSGITGAIAGAFLTLLINPSQLKLSFGVYSIFLGLIIFISSLKGRRELKKNGRDRKPSTVQSIGYGFAGGLVSGTFGTSGAVPVLAGLFAMSLPVRMVIGTSVVVIFFNTLSAMAGHLFISLIDMSLVLLLSAGAVLGALAGPFVLSGVDTVRLEIPIKKTFAFVVALVGVILIFN